MPGVNNRQLNYRIARCKAVLPSSLGPRPGLRVVDLSLMGDLPVDSGGIGD